MLIVAVAGRGRERGPVGRDAAPAPADASVDAPWRLTEYLGNLTDIQHLLDRDCPPDTPPVDSEGYGREVHEAGFECRAQVRPGLWRLRSAYATPKGQKPDVKMIMVGYMWSAGQPYPVADCKRARDEELVEYYRELVRTPGTGAPPPPDDEAALRRALWGEQDADVETSTGPLVIRFGGNTPRYQPPGEGGCEWTLYGGFETTPQLPSTKQREARER